MSDCDHPDFEAYVAVSRLTRSDEDPEVCGLHAELRVWCTHCEEPMEFVGDLPLGMIPSGPTRSIDGQTLMVPLRPASAPPEWGLDRPGMIGRYTGPPRAEPN